MESSGGSWTSLATAYLPVPGPTDLTIPGQNSLERLEFSSDTVAEPLGTAVGSGGFRLFEGGLQFGLGDN